MKTFEFNRDGIRRASYDPALQRLEIEFLRGPRYQYDAVPESVVQWFVRTKDAPGYLKRVITPGFVYRKLGKPQPTPAIDLERQLRASIEGARDKKSS